MTVSLSSISLSTLPRSSSRGPMYCPGLRGEGSGSMGLGRSGSGRLGRSNRVLFGPVAFSVFRISIGEYSTFQSRNGRSVLLRNYFFRVERAQYSRIQNRSEYTLNHSLTGSICFRAVPLL
jgi:hypothetical protein